MYQKQVRPPNDAEQFASGSFDKAEHRLNDKDWNASPDNLSPVWTGLRGVCPRCGQGHLFYSFINLRRECDVCGLDYSFADPADGPAFFVLCFTSVPAVAIAIWIEVSYSPPLWIHLLTSLPLVLLACLLPLRPIKGWLINSQYYYKAEEGRIDREHKAD